MQKEYGARGFQALGVAYNEGAEVQHLTFIRQFQPVFPVGYSGRAAVIDYLQFPANLPGRVPIFVFIDRKGMIRGRYMGDDPFFRDEEKNTRKMIESLLAAGKP